MSNRQYRVIENVAGKFSVQERNLLGEWFSFITYDNEADAVHFYEDTVAQNEAQALYNKPKRVIKENV
jgi:hypothetical protein